jgi:thymidylate synthase (FAD)
MKVRLISYSQPNNDFANGGMDLQDLIAYSARVSNPSNQMNKETNNKLIDYLLKHSHWSPLEIVNACLEIETTRDIARQILRHRSFSFQEFSQRYADPTTDLGFDIREARLQDHKNRQNSIETSNGTLAAAWEQKQQDLIAKIKKEYQWAIEHGIAKEQARAILPEGNTVSRMYMAGSIRSWVHYINLRTGPETQKEHREVARACAEALEPVFPMITQFVK